VATVSLLTDDNIDRILLPEYQSGWQEIMDELSKVPSLAFIYEKSLDHILAGAPEIVIEEIHDLKNG
jgi:hypothetical protein